MNNLIFIFFLFLLSFFFCLTVSGQVNKKKHPVQRDTVWLVKHDTIWIMNDVMYYSNPLKKRDSKIIKSSGIKSVNPFELNSTGKHNYFRSLVDYLNQTEKNNLNKDSLASIIIELDTIFSGNWVANSIFDTTSENVINGELELILIRNTEKYYYNQWGSFNWGYGPRWGRMHRGLDLSLNIGDTIFSSFNGIVRYAQWNDGGYGNCVIVRHFNGIETLYAHMSKIIVTPGQLVYTYEPLGLGGSTGRSTGPHLHFETRYKGHSFDPLKIFNKDLFTLHSDTLRLTTYDITDPIIPKNVSSKKYHIVKSSENLSQIAKKYKTTVYQIQKLNGLANINRIKAGQKIRVK